MGLNCKKTVGKMRSITRKLENQLAEEAKLQKEKKQKKNNNQFKFKQKIINQTYTQVTSKQFARLSVDNSK